jgi:Uma2 family endonuclease
MPTLPEDHRFEVVPDWVCEVLSPTTQKKDRVTKMKAYDRYGVAFLWLANPLAQLPETYILPDGVS